MERVLGGYSGRILPAFRFMAGAMFACHGAQKLFGALGGQQATGNKLMLAAGIIEFAGGLLIAIGLVTSIAAFIASGERRWATSCSTRPGASGRSSKGELAVLYCFVFLYIAAHGP